MGKRERVREKVVGKSLTGEGKVSALSTDCRKEGKGAQKAKEEDGKLGSCTPNF